MTIEPIEHSSLYCLFADEIRREADGRDTIVGWYPDNSKIALPPEGGALLSRLMVAAILVIPLAHEPGEMVFELVLNDTVLHTITMPQQQIQELRSADSGDATALRAKVMRMAVQSQNMLIGEPGNLRARITMGGQVLHSNSLKFVREEPSAT